MTQTDVWNTDYSGHMTDDFDLQRLGRSVVRAAGMLEMFGWSSPAAMLEYVLPLDPETQLLIDLLTVGRSDAPPEVRERLRALAHSSDILDEIAAAMI